MNSSDQQSAVVLLSGGLDSTTTLAIAQHEGYRAYCLSFCYGQRHVYELESAQRIAAEQGVASHEILEIDLGRFGGSALTDNMLVPKHQRADEIGKEIPITYVPARNTVFLSLALAYAESLNTGHIFIGVNSLDYSGYPDCRPEYIAAFQAMANLATKGAVEGTLPVEIHTPLIELSKSQIITLGLELGVNYSLTTSCYDPLVGGISCGHCDACLLRLRGFAENNVPDPIQYAT